MHYLCSSPQVQDTAAGAISGLSIAVCRARRDRVGRRKVITLIIKMPHWGLNSYAKSYTPLFPESRPGNPRFADTFGCHRTEHTQWLLSHWASGTGKPWASYPGCECYMQGELDVWYLRQALDSLRKQDYLTSPLQEGICSDISNVILGLRWVVSYRDRCLHVIVPRQMPPGSSLDHHNLRSELEKPANKLGAAWRQPAKQASPLWEYRGQTWNLILSRIKARGIYLPLRSLVPVPSP